ncbi:MAG: T9SS type A sorting domain-containing protein [Chlorobi bacterium]|nr:T9SS type A sorting domain-containing protein [Chlorobiota bacterium]MCI0715856.1 T9SS type A sorting domain-containing protein [Chlorobiota bacterium]
MKKIIPLFASALFLLLFSIKLNAATWTVQVFDFGFNPANLPNVHIGDSIKWNWTGPTEHTTTSSTIPNGATSWNEILNGSNTTYIYVVTVAGSYDYFCVPHPFMVGSFTASPIGITPIAGEVPKSFKLNQNYPNPFNPVTDIKFDIPVASYTKLTVLNILGQEIEVLVNQQLSTGSYKVDWNASNYPSGVYFYKLEAGDFVDTKKMILIK